MGLDWAGRQEIYLVEWLGQTELTGTPQWLSPAFRPEPTSSVALPPAGLPFRLLLHLRVAEMPEMGIHDGDKDALTFLRARTAPVRGFDSSPAQKGREKRGNRGTCEHAEKWGNVSHRHPCPTEFWASGPTHTLVVAPICSYHN